MFPPSVFALTCYPVTAPWLLQVDILPTCTSTRIGTSAQVALSPTIRQGYLTTSPYPTAQVNATLQPSPPHRHELMQRAAVCMKCMDAK